jgi:hypothetical protein
MPVITVNLTHPAMAHIDLEEFFSYETLADFIRAHPECFPALGTAEISYRPDPSLN